MSALVSRITSVSIVCTTVCSGADQRKHQKLHIPGLCEENPPVTGGYPSQRAGYTEIITFDEVIMNKTKQNTTVCISHRVQFTSLAVIQYFRNISGTICHISLSGAGGSKPISCIHSLSSCSEIIARRLASLISRSYLACVAASEL